ncbi:hypothetical protein C8Q77DRAFT_1217290 [Trametes polyzona]|nr:hypothetical protein C8Q77DRAFT_1217290 [Trametes polyzona]
MPLELSQMILTDPDTEVRLRGRPYHVCQHIPHDGQYIDWWVQAGRPGEGGGPPQSLHVTFYQDMYSCASGGANAPEYYTVLNGAFPNGTAFAYDLPATTATVSHVGKAVSSYWTDADSLENSADLSTSTVPLDCPEFGAKGTLDIQSDAPYHFGCNTTFSPYSESALPANVELTESEAIFFQQRGWATSQPGDAARVDVTLGNSCLQFPGLGYHEQNWRPLGCGQFHTGFFERAGTVPQYQCSLQGSRTGDAVTITLYGLVFDAPSGVNVMEGFVLKYTLKDGEQHRVDIMGQSLQYFTGVLVYDWLNPSLRPYNG